MATHLPKWVHLQQEVGDLTFFVSRRKIQLPNRLEFRNDNKFLSEFGQNQTQNDDNGEKLNCAKTISRRKWMKTRNSFTVREDAKGTLQGLALYCWRSSDVNSRASCCLVGMQARELRAFQSSRVSKTSASCRRVAVLFNCPMNDQNLKWLSNCLLDVLCSDSWTITFDVKG